MKEFQPLIAHFASFFFFAFRAKTFFSGALFPSLSLGHLALTVFFYPRHYSFITLSLSLSLGNRLFPALFVGIQNAHCASIQPI